MRRDASTAVAAATFAVAVLAGCVVTAPGAAAPTGEATAPAAPPPSSTTAAEPEPSSPAPSTSSPAPTTDPATPGSGPYVTIDGEPGGTWVQTLRCTRFTPTGLQLTGDTVDTSGSLVGSVSLRDGTWGSVGILLTNGDRAYFQVEEFAPATIEGTRMTIEFAVSGMSGDIVPVVLGVDCEGLA